MRVRVLSGSVVYKGDEYEAGKEFECEKAVAESLIKGNIVEVINKTNDKKAEAEAEADKKTKEK